MTKDLAYGIFMKKAMNDMLENGQIYKLTKKWEVAQRSCEPLLKKGRPMGIEKTVSLFLVLVIGMIFALVTMIFEYVGHQDEVDTKNYNVEEDELDVAKTNLECRIKEVQDNLDIKALNDLADSIKTLKSLLNREKM